MKMLSNWAEQTRAMKCSLVGRLLMGTARSMNLKWRGCLHLLGPGCSFKRQECPGPVLVHKDLQALEAYLKAVLHGHMQVASQANTVHTAEW